MSKAIAKKDDTTAVVPQTEAATIFSLIERMATDQTVSIERVQQAFTFYQSVQADQARKLFEASFAKMQPDLPAVERKGTGHNNAKYARWEDIAEAVAPVLRENGFGLRFRISDADNKIKVACILSHVGGHSEETSFTFPYDTSGGKNAIQAIGSAKTYGQRYTATAILGIATCKEDDDGNAAGSSGDLMPISEAQVAELIALADKLGVDKERFCKATNIESFADILGKDFPKAKKLMEMKGKKS